MWVDKHKTTLALDTTGLACSVSILHQDKIYSEHIISGTRHSNFLPQVIEELCQQSKINIQHIEQILVGNGPGLFTGIRIGVGFAQGLSLALKVPCFSLSSLYSIALNNASLVENYQVICVLVDAKMAEVYMQWFIKNQGQIKVLSEAELINFTEKSDQIKFHKELSKYQDSSTSQSQQCHIFADSFLTDVDFFSHLDKNDGINIHRDHPENMIPSVKGIMSALKKGLLDESTLKTEPSIANYVRNNVAY